MDRPTLRDRGGALLDVEPRVFKLVFELALLSFTLTILGLSFQYETLFPQIIAVPTALLLLAAIALDAVPGLRDRLPSGGAAVELPAPETDDEERSLPELRGKSVEIVAWIGAVLASIFVVGIIPTAVGFLVLYYRRHTDMGLRTALVYTVGFVGAILVVFDFFLGLAFYGGVLGVLLGGR